MCAHECACTDMRAHVCMRRSQRSDARRPCLQRVSGAGRVVARCACPRLAQVGAAKLSSDLTLNWGGIEGFRIAGKQGIGIIAACQVRGAPVR